jgi:hypothetical protein
VEQRNLNEKSEMTDSPKNKLPSPKKTMKKKIHQRTMANADDIFIDENDKLNNSQDSASSYKENSIHEVTKIINETFIPKLILLKKLSSLECRKIQKPSIYYSITFSKV